MAINLKLKNEDEFHIGLPESDVFKLATVIYPKCYKSSKSCNFLFLGRLCSQGSIDNNTAILLNYPYF